MITVTGQIEVNRFPQIARAFPDRVSAATGKALQEVSNRSLRWTPVRKGFLKGRRQVRFHRGALSGSVYWSMGYAGHQEFGTSRGIRPKRFARNAVDSVKPEYIAALSHIEKDLA